MHRRPLQPVKPEHLLSNKNILSKRKKISSIVSLANNRFATIFHRTSNTTSLTKNTSHQDLDSENDFPSSLGIQRNGDHFFLRGRNDPGGYWWPPTCSNWLLFSFLSSSCSSVLLCNCGFYAFRVVWSPTHILGGY
jgi:hypothetical protein